MWINFFGRSLSVAATLVLGAAPVAASDPMFTKTSLMTWEALDARFAQARQPKWQGPVKTVVTSYAKAGDRVTDAAVDAVPGVALASRPLPGALAPDTRAWGMGTGFSARIGADARGPALRSRGAGFVAGVDRLLDPTLLAGVALNFTEAETSSSGVRQDFRTFSGGAYVAWAPFDGWELDGFLGNSWVELDSRRVINLPGAPVATAGRSRGPGVSAAGSAGYRFRSATSFGEAYAKPFASLGYVAQQRRGFVESGPLGPGLVFPSETFERSTLNLGVAAGIEVSAGDSWTLRPELRLAWSRYLSDPSPQVPAFLFGTPVMVVDPEPGRDGALVSVEVAGWKRRELQAFAGYAGEFRANSTVHQGRGGVRLAW